MTPPYRTCVPHMPPETCRWCGRGPDAEAIDRLLAQWLTGKGDFPVVYPRELVLFLEESRDEMHRAFVRLLVSTTPEETERAHAWMGRAARMWQAARRDLVRWATYDVPPLVLVERRLTDDQARELAAVVDGLTKGGV